MGEKSHHDQVDPPPPPTLPSINSKKAIPRSRLCSLYWYMLLKEHKKYSTQEFFLPLEEVLSVSEYLDINKCSWTSPLLIFRGITGNP